VLAGLQREARAAARGQQSGGPCNLRRQLSAATFAMYSFLRMLDIGGTEIQYELGCVRRGSVAAAAVAPLPEGPHVMRMAEGFLPATRRRPATCLGRIIMHLAVAAARNPAVGVRGDPEGEPSVPGRPAWPARLQFAAGASHSTIWHDTRRVIQPPCPRPPVTGTQGGHPTGRLGSSPRLRHLSCSRNHLRQA
jgi:hypothetical protein